MTTPAREFYEKAYQEQKYISPTEASQHGAYQRLAAFISQYELADKYCLEVGSGRGGFQDLVPNYVGTDIAESAGIFMHKPFVVASATALPFPDHTFDGIWTVYVFEHVPNPERGLEELWRVLKPGGYLYFEPAWHCRPWAAQGYPVRPYSDFDWKGKLVKALIPIRNNILYRSVKAVPVRLMHLLKYQISRQPTPFVYGELEPNYEIFWMSDSDALNSMDPFEAYLWFTSRGGKCLNYPTTKKAFLMRHGPLIIHKPSDFGESHD